MFTELLHSFNSYSVVFSFITLIIGIIVGNWQAIGRDKRKEFNDLSIDLFTALSNQIKHGRYAVSADTKVCLLIEHYIPVYKRARFRRHVRRYESAQQDISTYDPTSGVATINEENFKHLMSCAKKLFSYVKRR